MSSVLGKISKLLVGLFQRINKYFEVRNKKERGKKTNNTRSYIHACSLCLLALLHSGRHERTTTTTVCSLLPCAGPTTVLLWLRYVDITVAFGAWFVPSWFAQKKKKQVQKTKASWLCSSELVAELMIQLALTVSPRRAPSQQSCSPRGWCSPVP